MPDTWTQYTVGFGMKRHSTGREATLLGSRWSFNLLSLMLQRNPYLDLMRQPESAVLFVPDAEELSGRSQIAISTKMLLKTIMIPTAKSLLFSLFMSNLKHSVSSRKLRPQM